MKLTGKYKEDDVKKETISLSIASGVACSLTSFVAVEERSEATVGGAWLSYCLLARLWELFCLRATHITHYLPLRVF
jgi:hypothetical protein